MLSGGFAAILDELRVNLRPDAWIVCIVLALLLALGPGLARNTDNARTLAAFANDEPWLTLVLDGMTRWPYGDPSNYLRPDRYANQLPPHWDRRYDGIFYYGGTYLGLAFLAYAPLRVLGLDVFPTAPIVLRALSLLASILSLLVLYNFVKRQSGVVAAVLVALFVATDSYFVLYATLIHPDAVQLFFGLLALLLAVRHAGDGSMASLAGFGLVCGIVQGTKVGAPWLAPLALLTVHFGLQARMFLDEPRWKQYLERCGVLAMAGLAGWFISTPYAFVGGYYFGALYRTWGMVKSGPFGTVNVVTWLDALHSYLGTTLSAIAIAAVLWGIVRGVSGSRAMALAVALAVSQILYFGNVGGLWVVLGYLLVALSLLAALAADAFATALRHLRASLGRGGAAMAAILGALALLAVIESRWYTVADTAADQRLAAHSTVYHLNAWARDGAIDPRAKIVYDDLAYFDPTVYRDVRMHGGVLTWRQLRSYRPDVVVLSSSLYGAPWYVELRGKQRLQRDDPNEYSMRLYQDLLDSTAPGPTAIPGVELLKSFSANYPPAAPTPPSPAEQALRRLLLQASFLPSFVVNKLDTNVVLFFHYRRLMAGAAALGDSLAVGPSLKVYHLDWQRLDQFLERSRP
jgi:hypothetical protein